MATITYQNRPEVQYINREGVFIGAVVEARDELKNGDTVFVVTLANDEGERITDRLYFTERAMWRVEKFLKKAGLIDAGFEPGDVIEITPEDIMGARVKFSVRNDPYTPVGAEKPKDSYKVGNYYGVDEATDAPKQKAPETATGAPVKRVGLKKQTPAATDTGLD